MRCHGPDAAVREADLRLDSRESMLSSGVIDLNDADQSILLQRIRAHGEDRMPPQDAGRALSDDEVAILSAWMTSGAPLQTHWSFQKIEPPKPPMLGALKAWPQQPLDTFVAAKLEQSDLHPSQEASRTTWLRRASLDIRGLPPTPEELDHFLNDESELAYEHAIDRFLASPHYGEYWASQWLDLARYADTQGYEQDRTRTIWPWRDWVIDAFNADMPFDEFTVRQLAGDLLPAATDADVLATAFHRNTMTNSEGGTRDEEYRVAAVIDRVNTTYQTWMGLTMSCAQCHTHKYDPITHEEYYQSFALLNQTADADRVDDAPHLEWQTPQQRAHAQEIAAVVQTLSTEIAQTRRTDVPSQGKYWIDDGLPPGATPLGEDASNGWPWRIGLNAKPCDPISGNQMSESSAQANAFAQHYFENSAEPIQLAEGEKIIAHVFLDPAQTPEMIMVQVHSPADLWEHRAYWGTNHGTWGEDGSPSRLRMGALPEPGTWTKLVIDPTLIGLPPGSIVDGIALSQYGGPDGGRVFWDAIGFDSDAERRHDWQFDRSAWERRLAAVGYRGTPSEVADALRVPIADRTPAHNERIEAEWRYATGTLPDTKSHFRDQREALAQARLHRVTTPVMRALPKDGYRATHILTRGAWNDPAEQVRPGVPQILQAPTAPNPQTRLDFAYWIASESNPLTARVYVNRIWESIFGQGIVETSEDFGTQGDLPTNQPLLDHLATRVVDLGWSQKALLKEICTSATYRQSSQITEDLVARDPDNTLLARGPRFRLSAETIRDQALAISGLLDRTLHGPPVFPAQPDGTWQVVYNGAQWAESPPGDRHRRGLYTFWRRTAPYPSMMTFDAPSREFCVSRRIRTNTPLQALVTLNDPVYLEASAHLGQLMHEIADNDHARLTYGFRRATGRPATSAELEMLESLLIEARDQFNDDPDSANEFVRSCRLSQTENTTELAAWAIIGNVLLNLDEVLVKS